jgi:hypothetical protein
MLLHHVVIHFQFLSKNNCYAYTQLVWPPSMLFASSGATHVRCVVCHIGVSVWQSSEATSMPTTSGQLVLRTLFFCSSDYFEIGQFTF